MEKDRIIDRIRKLLALATSPNQAEAESAAAKAQALLQQHNLELAQVEQSSKQQSSMIQKQVDIHSRQRWRRLLIHTIARANFCRALFKPGQASVILVGEPHNLEVAEYLYTYRQLPKSPKGDGLVSRLHRYTPLREAPTTK
jgi:uncharacterized DUF497 family protein